MIKRVQGENFLSWEKLDVDVQSGVTLIDGWNEDDQTSEGSGKSAILNAISWCLYGKLPKESKIDDVIKHGAKGCRVQVEIDRFRVIRCRKPNDLLIMYADGSEVRGKDAKETQELIEQAVGLSFEAFCQTVYFAQNYPKKFLTSNQEERAKILSEAQDLDVFTRASKEAHTRLKREKERLKDLETETLLIDKDRQIAVSNLETAKYKAEEAKRNKEASLKQTKMAMEGYQLNYNEALEALSTYKNAVRKADYSEQAESAAGTRVAEIESQLSSLKKRLSEVDSDLKRRQLSEKQVSRLSQSYEGLLKQKKQNEAFLANPTKDCPTCGTKLENLDTSHTLVELSRLEDEILETLSQINSLQEELKQPKPNSDKIKAEIDSTQKLLQEARSELSSQRAKRQSRDSLFHKIETQEAKVKELHELLTSLAKEYKELEKTPVEVDYSEVEKIQKKIDELDSRIAANGPKMEQLQTQIQRLEVLKAGFKDVKTYVFNTVLNEINSRIHDYLQKLFEMPVRLTFVNEEGKISTDLKLNDQDLGLGLASGGQARRLNLAVDLALSDVISARKGKSLGILILDEYFKDLSEQSMEKCLSLLEARQQPVLLIEHNSIFKNIITNHITVKLTEGTSYVASIGEERAEQSEELRKIS